MELHTAFMQACLIPHRRLAVLGHGPLLVRPVFRGACIRARRGDQSSDTVLRLSNFHEICFRQAFRSIVAGGSSYRRFERIICQSPDDALASPVFTETGEQSLSKSAIGHAHCLLPQAKSLV